jgi:hypothetical protein
VGGAFAGADSILGIARWRWVFLVNVPITAAALFVVARVLNIPHTRREHRTDWTGVVALTVGVIPVLLTAEQGRDWGWDSVSAIGCYALAAAGLIGFGVAERWIGDEALLPLRLFRNSVFSVTSAACLIIGMGMFGGLVLALFGLGLGGCLQISSRLAGSADLVAMPAACCRTPRLRNQSGIEALAARARGRDG